MRRAPGLHLSLLILLVATGALAAQAPDGDPPSPAPTADEPGFRLGPLRIVPVFTIGRIALDTNVNSTEDGRVTDVTGSAGPGLEVVLPIRNRVFLTGRGHLDYLYFVRSDEERRLTGSAGAALELRTRILTAGVNHGYRRTFDRSEPEIATRVEKTQESTTLTLQILGPSRQARFGVVTNAGAERLIVAPDQQFLGADLARNTNRDVYRGALELRYRFTGKTSLFAGGDHQMDRFTEDSARDTDSNRMYIGLEVTSSTLLDGRIAGGVRLVRPKDERFSEQPRLYIQGTLGYHFSPHTHLQGGYSHDVSFSAFTIMDAPPLVTQQTMDARLDKGLWRRLQLRLHVSRTRLLSAGTARYVAGDRIVSAVRNDVYVQAGANLGYLFRSRLRVGLGADYRTRDSNVADLGIEGLLLGATVELVRR